MSTLIQHMQTERVRIEIRYSPVWDEYSVVPTVSGIRDDAATYYTNDLDDARSTASHMLQNYTETQS